MQRRLFRHNDRGFSEFFRDASDGSSGNDGAGDSDEDTRWGGWFGKVRDWLVSGFQSISEGLGILKDNVAQGIANIIKSLSGVAQAVSDKIIDLKDSVAGFLGDIVDSVKFIPEAVGGFVSDIIDNIKRIPEAVADKLIYLFVPTGSGVDGLKNLINEKYPFISQLGVWIQSLTYGDYSEDAPNFSITYNGETYNLIDFTLFEQYRLIVLGISSVLLLTSFIFWLVKFVPKLLKGVN